MCHYSDVLGGGDALAAQALTSLSIAAGIVFWVLAYRWQRVDLRPHALPIALWILSGALDILITARGTLDDPLREGNPLAREIFVAFGFFGPAIASVLWISLWSLLVLAINKKMEPRRARIAKFVSLSIFYSLAFGHVLGFSSWFAPLCAISRSAASLAPLPLRIACIAVAGCALAAAHALVTSLSGANAPARARCLHPDDSRARRRIGGKGRSPSA